MPDLSKLPSVDQLLQNPKIQGIIHTFGRPLTLKALREVLDTCRRGAIQQDQTVLEQTELIQRTQNLLNDWLSPTLIPVINATGVILHTNLGRAPLSIETRAAISATSAGYSNLEFDLQTGKRGRRSIHASRLLSTLTGAEGGFVVNNNAGAVLLILSALAKGKNVLISRTQLVEIGGGFRIPDVMRQSGAKLLEIGTTNRVHRYDYENALKNEAVTLVLVAHHSNFKLIGFHSEPALTEIVTTAHKYDVPVVHDLGSGALLDTADYSLAHEPTVQESLHAGCDLVSFSGDKLMGGPQAGVIIGKESLLNSIRVHPLARALRPDKVTLAGMTATITHYLKNEAQVKIPVWYMISRSIESLEEQANNWREYLGAGQVIKGCSTVGGGSLPTEEMSTFLLAIAPKKPDAFMQVLRESSPPIIARIKDDKVLFDPRTVLPEQEAPLLRCLLAALENEDS
ncbi:MAG: L-seryl-tRNA(Sec) selenium transferase [Chloroflexota bacterium]|nr:L-seryl-tRNA(Sec) selenium transferase [Chloroflexota bacterium]